MNKNKKTSKAFDILHRRYIGENAERQASFEAARERRGGQNYL